MMSQFKKSWATLAEYQTQDFCKCFSQWHKCFACCVKLEGNCFV